MALSRGFVAWSSLAAAFILFVAVNVIAEQELRGSRIDLTESHLYTLSPGTRRVLARIEELITLRFYYSPQLGSAAPPYGIYAERVREMLQQYAALAPGKIKLDQIDPEPFSSAEDRAVAFGLQGVALQQGGDQVYFGLAATNATDDQQTIQFFQPDRERFLEYDLTKLIYSLAFPKKTVVGLLSSLPLEGDFEAAMRGAPLTPYAIYEQMKQLYDVHDLQADLDKVPDDVDVLMLVHPQHLAEKAQYAIDQYVLKGGKALIFVDPYAEAQAAKQQQQAFDPKAEASDLPLLFKAWGLEMLPGEVAGDRTNARRVNIGTSASPRAVDYIAWLALDQSDVNRDSPITGDLTQLNFATAGILRPVTGATTTFTPLVFTSTASQDVPVAKVAGFPDVQALLDGFKSSGKPLTVAARITGPAVTAFPSGPPTTATADKDKKDPKPAVGQPAEIKTAVKPINLVVVADTDMLADRFWVDVQDFVGQKVAVPNANNGDLVTNAIDTLSGGDDLIGLRTRGTAARPFTLVQNIQRAADERYQDTEKGLEKQLKETQDKIRNLSGRDPQSAAQTTGDAGANSLEQAQTLDNFRAELLKVRRQLRAVQLALRQDIDQLRTEIEFADIAAIPILVGVVAIILGLVRMNRRRRRAQTG
ncbi:MAG TPA: Gldg family protein [Stellaceae bacterium]|nr:Gldg family protein [Stellaceae bacterium]